jgi:uncharacterized membrane protein
MDERSGAAQGWCNVIHATRSSLTIGLNRFVLRPSRVDKVRRIAEKVETMLISRFMRTLSPVARRYRRRAPLLAILAGLGFGASAAPALADFRVCNATQSLVGVAIGYRAQAGWVTEGWWHIEASSCKTLIEGALASRYYYLYAEDAQRGGRWEGEINMCVAEREFKISGPGDCFARGFQRAGFQEYDTREQSSWMVQLTDEPAGNGLPAVTGGAAPANGATPNQTSNGATPGETE